VLITEAPAALSMLSKVGSAARIFSPLTVSGPPISRVFEANPPGVHHQVTICTPFFSAISCSFLWNAVPLRRMAWSMLVIVPGMMMMDISGTLPTAYDIGKTAISRVPACSASNCATGLM